MKKIIFALVMTVLAACASMSAKKYYATGSSKLTPYLAQQDIAVINAWYGNRDKVETRTSFDKDGIRFHRGNEDFFFSYADEHGAYGFNDFVKDGAGHLYGPLPDTDIKRFVEDFEVLRKDSAKPKTESPK